MTVSDLCARAQITRQWLNKLVDRGEVPCCSRKPNDRLIIGASPDLDTWIERTARRQKRKQGRRLSLKDRLDRFSRIPDSDQYTVSNLAKKIGVTASTVRRRIVEIPGAFYDGEAYRIRNTPDLKQWIETETMARLQERERLHRERLKRKSLRTLKAPFLVAGAAISKARVDINRMLYKCPLKAWDRPELLVFRQDLEFMIQLACNIDAELETKKSKRS
jgi:hypothetical protein